MDRDGFMASGHILADCADIFDDSADIMPVCADIPDSADIMPDYADISDSADIISVSADIPADSADIFNS